MKKIYQIIMLFAIGIALVGCSADYRKAVKDGDFDTAHDIVNQLHDEYLQINERHQSNNQIYYNLRIGESPTTTYRNAKNAYFDALNYVYENEIRLIASQDMNCSGKIAYLISEIPLDGEMPTEGECDYMMALDALGEYKHDNLGIHWERYISSVQAVNKICDKTLNLAISQNNEELARTVIGQYKDNIEIHVRPGHDVEYTTKSKDAAMEKVIKKFGNE